MFVEKLLEELNQWADLQTEVKAIALIGSHARGQAHAKSDIDLVFIVTNPEHFLSNEVWLSQFGEIESIKREDWGLVKSWRVHYKHGAEIEFGITTTEWLDSEQLKEATGRIIRDGAQVVFDPARILAHAIEAINGHNQSQR